MSLLKEVILIIKSRNVNEELKPVENGKCEGN